MGRRFVVDRLPIEVRKQLLEHHQQYPGWTISDHSRWLLEQGYEVSRSAVHRFLKAKGDEPLPFVPLQHSEELRMRCLEVAATVYSGASDQELMALASSLLSWVQEP